MNNSVSKYFAIKRAVIDTIEFFLAIIYSATLSLLRKKKRHVIIYYHGVRDAERQGFEKQISYLARRYRVLPVTELIRAPNNHRETLVAITFDDGFTSVVDNGWSILKKYGLRATMFTPVGNLGRPPQWTIESPWVYDRNEIVVDRQSVAKLDREGLEMLSHTVSHPVLTQVDDKQLEFELVQSRRMLEEIVGHEVVGLSYPLGRYNKAVVAAAERAGYKYAFTVEPLTVDDSPNQMVIGRFVVNPNMNMLKFKLKVSGAYQMTCCLRKMKSRLLGSVRG